MLFRSVSLNLSSWARSRLQRNFRWPTRQRYPKTRCASVGKFIHLTLITTVGLTIEELTNIQLGIDNKSEQDRESVLQNTKPPIMVTKGGGLTIRNYESDNRINKNSHLTDTQAGESVQTNPSIQQRADLSVRRTSLASLTANTNTIFPVKPNSASSSK